MSAFFDVSLLGIIGTITGIAALAISYRNYSRQRPNLKIKLRKCVHDFPSPIRKPKNMDINFHCAFQIKNVGDRGTKIESIALSFTVDGKNYQTKEEDRSAEISEISSFHLQSSAQNRNRWIQAHDTVDINSHFKVLYDREKKEKINCSFAIHDTHKKYVVKGISYRKQRPPIEPGPYKK